MNRRIFDCFAFFNELDLLELRLKELNSVVDKFVLVEATRTFQKKEKPLYFEQNKHLFKKYLHKINHVIIDSYPTFWTKFRPVTTWHYDNHQKEGALKGITEAHPEDLILFSDLDEIPLPNKVLEVRDQTGIRVFEQFISYYFLNYVCTYINDNGGKAIAQKNRDGFARWRGSVMMEKKLITTLKDMRNFRDTEGPHIKVIPDAGWHFSYMGGLDKIIHKIDNWAHAEYNTEEFKSKRAVLNNIISGKDLFNDGMQFKIFDIHASKLPFPESIKSDVTRWKSFVKTTKDLEDEIKIQLSMD